MDEAAYDGNYTGSFLHESGSDDVRTDKKFSAQENKPKSKVLEIYEKWRLKVYVLCVVRVLCA